MSTHVRLFGEAPTPATEGVAIFRKGFRPFFFLGALYAIALLPIWLGMLAGVSIDVDRQLTGVTWHAHELLFGFAGAIIAGFMLTAVGNWTGNETATGLHLALLCALWIAGRLAVMLPIPQTIATAIDLSFIPALAFTVARPLVRTGNRRNFVMLGVLGAYWLGNLAIWTLAWRTRGLRCAIDVIILLIVLLTGRVLPMFTRNATKIESIRSIPILDRLAILSMVLVTTVDATLANSYVRAAAYATAAILVAARTVHWGMLPALRVPMLWILHAGHAFVVIGLVMRALPIFVPVISESAAIHAFTVGAIGCTTLGMMSRVSLGHTGRLIEAPRPMIVAFAALVLGAIVRVVGPHWATTYALSLYFAGTAWTLAFALFLWCYTPMLFSPRIDGKAG